MQRKDSGYIRQRVGKNGAPKEEEKRKATQKVLGCSEHMKEQGHTVFFVFCLQW